MTGNVTGLNLFSQDIKTLLHGDFSGFSKGDAKTPYDKTAIDTYNNMLERTKNVQKAVEKATFNTDEATKQFIMNAKGGIIDLTTVQDQYTFKAKAAATATTFFSTALNTIVAFAAVAAITAIVKAIDNYVHRLDKAKEALSTTQGEVQSVNSELEETAKQIDEINSKDHLSITDKEELEQLRLLNEELRIRQQYLKDQETADKKKVADLSKEKYNQLYGISPDYRKEVDKYKDYLKTPAQPQPVFSEDYVPSAPVMQTSQLNTESNSLAALIAQYELYSEEKKKAIQDNDEESISKYNQKLTDIATTLRSDRTELQGLKEDISLTGEASTELDNVNSRLKLIDDTLLSPGRNLENFINSDAIKEDKNELLRLANTGKLTAVELSKNFSKVDNYLRDNGLTLEDLISILKVYKDEAASIGDLDTSEPKSLAEIISMLDEMTNKLSSVSELYKDFKENGTGDFNNESLSGIVEAFKEIKGVDIDSFLSTLTNSASTAKEVQEAFNSLASEYIYTTGILDNVTESNKNYIAAKLEEIGITNSAAIVEAQLVVQRNEAALSAALMTSATYGELAALRDEVAATEEARLAINQFYLEKLTANSISLATNGDIENIMSLVQACGSGITALQAFYRARQGLFDSFKATYDQKSNSNLVLGDIAKDRAMNEWKATQDKFIQDQSKLLADTQSEINAALNKKYTGKAGNYGGNAANASNSKGGGGGNKGGGGGSGAADQPKEIDWIERTFKLLEEKRAALEADSSSSFLSYLGISEEEFNRAKEIISSTSAPIESEIKELSTIAANAGLSMSQLYQAIQNGDNTESRRSSLLSILEIDKIALDQYKAAVEEYQKAYNDAAAKVSDEERDKIENGSFSIDSYTGSEAESIQAAIDAHDELRSILKDESDYKKKNAETLQAYYENDIAALDAQNEKISNSNTLIESQIGYLEESGRLVDAASYETMIHNLKLQQKITDKQLQKRKAELEALMSIEGFEGSEEYYALLDSISDCESSLYDLEEAQASYNNKLINMPIDNMDVLINMYSSIGSMIQNWGNDMEATGKKVDSTFYQSLISNGMTLIRQYEEQADLIREAMDEYDAGSEKWNELYNKLQNINSEMSSMVGNLNEWNQKLLQMPLDSINSQIESLQTVYDGLSKLQADHDTVINAVTGALQKQIDALNDEKEAVNEEYQSNIDGLQERLDLLNKQNEQLQLQTAYEQALYDLQIANTQKTEPVIREGALVYEQNVDNMRAAEEKLQDSMADLEQYKIQSQIEELNKELEKVNDKYDEQIKKLEKIAEKWQQIKSDVEDAQNNALADEYLGEGWQDKVLSGNDLDIFDAFKKNYETNAEMMKKYEMQIQTTENIYKLLESYITSYKEGVISYEQAAKGIENLLSQLNKDMSAGQNVQNILDYLSKANETDATAAAVLGGIQNSLSETSDELLKSLEHYNENLDLITDCMSSWEQLTDNISSIKDVLEEVSDNLADSLDSILSHNDDEDLIWDDRNNKPSNGNNDGNSRPNYGPGFKPDGTPLYKDGIENGLVGSPTPTSTGRKISLLATGKLEPDEMPVIAHRYEAILNTPQQEMLLENYARAQYMPTMDIPKLDYSGISTTSYRDVTFNFGNLELPDVRDVDGFAKAMGSQFASIMRQQLGKRR